MTPVVAPVPVGLSQRALRGAFAAAVFAFVLATLFDPADSLLGLKVPLYLLCWCTGILLSLSRAERIRLPIGLVVYVALMIAIPLVSIAIYFVADGTEPYAGFQLFKAYLFISMALLLYVTRTNLLPYLCVALTILAMAVLAVGTLVLLQPALFVPIYAFGNQYGMFSIDNRDYGAGLVLFQMYFVTSPMLAISAAYYFDRAAARRVHRVGFAALALLNTGAMIFAGSRNNLMAAVALPVALFLVHSKRKDVAVGVTALVTGIGLIAVSDQVRILLDPTEASNSTKLTTLSDYGTILERPATLIFGRGLGAYEQWTGRGSSFITELTYLEIIRNFGVFLGALMILLLVGPILYAYANRWSFPETSVIVGYLVYLAMCVTNPYLFSSMGMLILSVITANIAMHHSTRTRRSGYTA
jgi:hypothetical protein